MPRYALLSHVSSLKKIRQDQCKCQNSRASLVALEQSHLGDETLMRSILMLPKLDPTVRFLFPIQPEHLLKPGVTHRAATPQPKLFTA